MGEKEGYISLGDAAARAPGGVSANCVWRWCRNGVRGRNGDRIRLQHRRFGGRLYTRAEWIDEFTRIITEADQAHFDAKRRAGDSLPARDPRYGPSSQTTNRAEPTNPTVADDLERELREEGL